MPPNQTATGHTYIPNSYQKPNAFVDELMPLLSTPENVTLDAACRRILGWEEHRATRRDRIALSQFMDMTGLSRNTVRACLVELGRANILSPVGPVSGDGQEYELNLGQRGLYDTLYLAQRPRVRAGNPNPVEGMSAMNATRSQLKMPYMGVGGGQALTLQGLTPSIEMDEGLHLNGSPPSISMDTQKPKSQKGDIEIPLNWQLILGDAFSNRDTRDNLIAAITATQDGDILRLDLGPAFPPHLRQHLATIRRVARKCDIAYTLLNAGDG